VRDQNESPTDASLITKERKMGVVHRADANLPPSDGDEAIPSQTGCLSSFESKPERERRLTIRGRLLARQSRLQIGWGFQDNFGGGGVWTEKSGRGDHSGTQLRSESVCEYCCVERGRMLYGKPAPRIAICNSLRPGLAFEG
jgi:hypothetical protein